MQRWDASVLVQKNVSMFVFDCVTAGMPRLQGLASSPPPVLWLLHSSSLLLLLPLLLLPARPIRCSTFEKCVITPQIVITCDAFR